MNTEKLHRILNNIIRECDAIRGYIIDPVEGGDELIGDECTHIVKLAAQLAGCYVTEEVAEQLEEQAEVFEETVESAETEYAP